jgi:hypothetical protein
MTAAEIINQLNLDIFAALGQPVTYIPVAGTPVLIQALISSTLQSQPSGMGSETWAQHTTIEIMLSDLADAPAPGDMVNDGVNTYTLAAELENNGHFVKWVVT